MILDGYAYECDPPARSTDLISCFIQDEITLVDDRWYLTLGSKFEHNDFTGFEYQPTVRLLHVLSEREVVRASVSRAVRTPSRVDDDAMSRILMSPDGPTFMELRGNRAAVAEELLDAELGYRAQPTDDVSWDMTVFYSNYDELFTAAPDGLPFVDPNIPALIVPLQFENLLSADCVGAQLTGTHRLNRCWELTGAYSLLYIDAHVPSSDLRSSEIGTSPHNQVYVRSSWDLHRDWELDLIGRYVDNLPELNTSSYLTMDTRLAWRPNKHLEWAVVGRNLLDSPHTEFADSHMGYRTVAIEPEVFTVLTWIR